MVLDQPENFHVFCHRALRQVLQVPQELVARCEMSKRQFTDDKGVRQNPPNLEQVRELLVAAAQMVNPNGGVREYHRY